ncbi:hypothetical protein EVAR_46854_1 [Eumeta japonica]|uniref:Uncharacterized protein n=1 Tax=Eumeta variegata TaxID=151549 RepID=A0A4C1XPI3_EUMVA|nr:hypothetical protein EVAR_46854_1 [Eumeta japonica]
MQIQDGTCVALTRAATKKLRVDLKSAHPRSAGRPRADIIWSRNYQSPNLCLSLGNSWYVDVSTKSNGSETIGEGGGGVRGARGGRYTAVSVWLCDDRRSTSMSCGASVCPPAPAPAPSAYSTLDECENRFDSIVCLRSASASAASASEPRESSPCRNAFTTRICAPRPRASACGGRGARGGAVRACVRVAPPSRAAGRRAARRHTYVTEAVYRELAGTGYGGRLEAFSYVRDTSLRSRPPHERGGSGRRSSKTERREMRDRDDADSERRGRPADVSCRRGVAPTAYRAPSMSDKRMFCVRPPTRARDVGPDDVSRLPVSDDTAVVAGIRFRLTH